MKTTSSRARTLACALLATTAYCGLAAQPAAAQTQASTEPGLEAESRDSSPATPAASQPSEMPETRETETGAEPGPDSPKAEPAEADAASQSTLAGEEELPGLSAPPVHRSIDQNGVDLVYGTFNYSQTLVSIGGPGSAGLHYTRQYSGHDWTDNLTGSITFSDVGTTVTIDGVSDDMEGNGSTLAFVNGLYTYTGRDGKVARFQLEPLGFDSPSNARLLDITHPDGTVVAFHYRFVTDCSSGPCRNKDWRLQSVTSSRGYQIKLEYETAIYPGVGDLMWAGVNRVAAINNAIEYCEPAADHCALAGAWPAAQINRAWTAAGSSETVTDAGGGAWLYEYDYSDSSPLLVKVRRPGITVDDTQIQYASGDTYTYPRVSAVLRAGARYDYSVDYECAACTPPPPYVELATVEDPLDNRFVFKTRHQKYWYDAQARPLRYHAAILAATDPLGHTTTYDYDAVLRPIRVTAPEQNYVALTYDSRGNITTRTTAGKTNPQLNAFVETAGFPGACGNPKTCNKPGHIVDARQNRTDFDYAPEHGGLTLRTGPADSNGVRPQTRYTYEQRSGLVKTAGGGYATASAVWLLTRQAACRTSQATGNPAAPCATTGDEVVTTYDYGPSGQANNLLLRGIVVSADGVSLRTCYGYDALGNRISQTSPRAGLSNCQ